MWLTFWYLQGIPSPIRFKKQLAIDNSKHPHIYKMVLSRSKHCQCIIGLILDHFESGRNEDWELKWIKKQSKCFQPVWELKLIEKHSKCFQPVWEFEVISGEHDLHSVYHHWAKFLISICCTWKWEFQFPKHWCLKLQWRKSWYIWFCFIRIRICTHCNAEVSTVAMAPFPTQEA